MHAQVSPEALARLRAQQRNNTISSIIIAILLITLVGVILFLYLLPPIDKPTPEITYVGVPDAGEEVKTEKAKPIPSKPSEASASSSLTKAIASSSTSTVSIPVTDQTEFEESANFGASLGLDNGFGVGDFGTGAGDGASFFGNSVAGSRVLYVIDYSKSMQGEREALMRAELAKSIQELDSGMQYQVIMFAGPCWVAGDKVNAGRGGRGVVARPNGKEIVWGKNTPKGTGSVPRSFELEAKWLKATEANKKKTIEVVKKQELHWGTRWDFPLYMGFQMKPKPAAIIFMTDGNGGGVEVAEQFASMAKQENISITSIALMEPGAREGMIALAKGTPGGFSMIGRDGKKER